MKTNKFSLFRGKITIDTKYKERVKSCRVDGQLDKR